LAENPTKAAAPPNPSLQAFLHVAFLRDMHASSPTEREQQTAKYMNIQTQRDAKHYLAEVRQKVKPQRGVAGSGDM